jgi:hypothetical protein
MVQINKVNRRPSTSEQWNQSLSSGANFIENQAQMHQLNQIGQQYGISNLGQMSPDMQKIAFQQANQNQNELRKSQLDAGLENANYDQVKNAFGDKFANIWKAAPVGGKTELLKHGLDVKMRGGNIEEMLSNVPEKEIKEPVNEEYEIPKTSTGDFPSKTKWPDFKKPEEGYTPKEWRDERKTWRAENAPIYTKNKEHLHGLERDMLDAKYLTKLNESKKIPDSLGRLIINPDTREPYDAVKLAGAVSPEVQEWVKVAARFQNRAKEAYGSRVTNFDLFTYMKQFPDLLNTYEGRKRILRMMDINYKMDDLYSKSLQSIYNHYGLNGISQEKAEEFAKSSIADEIDKLHNEYLGLNAKNQMETGLTGKMVKVYDANGQVAGEIDQGEIDKLPEGFTVR